ncbi:glycogen/starch/alpha-glucan phosphorylase [Xanthobacteraceae bacterium Astr-EGSB]|uniref:glycogen/starch/alpha-glucan phosphorylase n=1 Tax=Astrobacterium formosum TaxID=3069710 RepID=UPI0027B5A4FD|nr:glycogen/starch/alpha-glucan phosphorylase [Xanthobacteraceae bacterium Astr-EGSB]
MRWANAPQKDRLVLEYTETPAISGETQHDTDVDAWKREFREHLFSVLGRFPGTATTNDQYLALAYTVRAHLLGRWARTSQFYQKKRARTVCYLSAEFLLGPHLGNNLVNLGAFSAVKKAMAELGIDFQALLEQEQEPGLGNGGLGRLAACFLDSLATLQIPATGHGIRYEYGMFDQQIRDGWQIEQPDKWLRLGNPWEIRRPEIAFDVGFGGHTEAYTDDEGRFRARWIPARTVRGVAYDTPILGYRVNTTNMLRLWSAEAVNSFDLGSFNTGDYHGAVMEKVASETISKVLYPDDTQPKGKQLRLEQQYFLVACALQDMVRIHLQTAPDLTRFHAKYALQLNDTHPALAVAELMRILVDENGMEWEEAWEVTRRTTGYTNHTLLPEALEKWPVGMFGSLLPRHLEIVYEINRRFLDEVSLRFPGDVERMRRLALIDETGERSVRMAHLACVGSHAVNGVAELHSELLKRDVLKDFHELWPQKFFNVTNGVTPRRFVQLINPRQSRLVTDAIGDGWTRDLEQLRALEPMADDVAFRAEWRAVKHFNRERLATEIVAKTGIVIDPDSLVDVQVKRFHEYKRQHLNLLHVVTLYHRLKAGGDFPSRTVVFAGKAAPGYLMAKRIIKLIHAVADVVNADPVSAGRLRVVFIPGYNVKRSQNIFPGADLSEQISLAGKEASGTGNMKFAMNGALTIGTLDGANIEIRDAVGAENFFLFGMPVEEVERHQTNGYRPYEHYQSDEELRACIDAMASGAFSHGDRELFRPVLENLLWSDPYMLLADYRSYVDCQEEVDRAWLDQEQWARMSILNVARMGYFSSDRSIRDYCRTIWHVAPVPIPDDVEV